MKILIKSKKAEHDAHTKRLSKLHKDSDKAESAYDSKRKAYEKAAKDHAEAVAKAESANRDPSVAPVKLKKLENEAVSLSAKEDTAKADYDLAQDSIEKFRTQYYTIDLRRVFNDMQKMEMERELAHAEQLIVYVKAFTSVHKVLGSCLDSTVEAAQSIKWATDSTRFVERTKTGNPPEMRINATVSAKKMLTAQQVNSKRVTKSKIFKTTSRKKDAIREDLGHLAPHQRERALREKLAELNTNRAKEAKAQAGLSSTIEAYTKNPAMGDKKSKEKLQKELEATNKQLAFIDEEILKVTLYLEAYQETKEQGNEEEDWDDDDGGADEEEEDAKTHGGEADSPTEMAAPQTTATTSAVKLPTPPSAVPSPPSPPKAVPSPPPPPPTAVPGRSTIALYAFEGSGDTEVSVSAQESVIVTEEDDQGSGWVRIVNSSGGEGYVPTSYIK